MGAIGGQNKHNAVQTKMQNKARRSGLAMSMKLIKEKKKRNQRLQHGLQRRVSDIPEGDIVKSEVMKQDTVTLGNRG